ncbi:MAG TPA: hypothetical protein VI279_11290 [Rhodocyclaceae bacterium]
MERADFSYQISDERLLAYSSLPLLDRLRWLDDTCRFTLLMRQAETIERPTPPPSPITSG